MLNNKQSVEDKLIQRPVKTTTQILYGKGLCGSSSIADKVSKAFLCVTRRSLYLEKLNDDVIQRFF